MIHIYKIIYIYIYYFHNIYNIYYIYIHVYVYVYTQTCQEKPWSDHPILGVEIAGTRKRF